jgi:hypothetical protein
MEYTFLFFLTQLLGQAPMLLAYVAGMIVALVFRRRYPRPSRITFFAMMLFLITTLVQLFLVSYFVQASIDSGWKDEKYGPIMAATGLVGSLLRVAALGLLLTAVFMGRTVAQESRPSPAFPPTEPQQQEIVEQGITTRPDR